MTTEPTKLSTPKAGSEIVPATPALPALPAPTVGATPVEIVPPTSPRLRRIQEKFQEWRDLQEKQNVIDAATLAVAKVALNALEQQVATPRKTQR